MKYQSLLLKKSLNYRYKGEEAMGFNFSEDEINEMYRMYQNALGTIQEQTQKVVEQITAKAQKLKYKPVIKLSVEAVTYYNEELKNAEMRALSEWQSSDLSFTRIMDKMSAGEGAKNRSRTLESQIEEEIQSWKPVDSSQLNGIDTTNWRCEVSDFEAIKQIIDKYVSSLEDQQNQCVNSIGSKKEENEIYISIEPVVLQSIAIVVEGFKSGINESFAELAQQFETRENEVRGLGAGAAQNAVSRSQSFVGGGVSALKAKVKQILD